MSKELKPLYLSLSRWRCGESGIEGTHSMGDGNTCLLNEEGFMCCLGQFEKQLDPNVRIRDENYPNYTKTTHPLLVAKRWVNSFFSYHAAKINDDEHSTIGEKIISLEVLAQYEGYTIIVVE